MDKATAEKKETKPKAEKTTDLTMVEAFIEFQKKVPSIKKTAKGNFGEYAPLDELIGKALPILNGLGFALMQNTWTDSEGQYWVQTILWYKNGEKMESGALKLMIEGVGMQKLGSAITYAKRYQVGSYLGLITANEDDDAQTAQDEAEAAQKAGMLADEKQRGKYLQYIEAWSRSLGIPVREDIATITTPEMIAEAQKVKTQVDEAEAAKAGAGGLADATA